VRLNRLRSLLPAIVLVSLISAWPARLAAQLAGIVGKVSDPSGASIRGATVRVTNTVTGLEWQAKTSPQGDYSLGLLPPGVYVVEATADGFSPARANGIELAVNSTRHIDLRLALPEVKENLSVEAAAPLVETETSEQGLVIGKRMIGDLPLNGRDFLRLARLAPGVSGAIDNPASPAGPFNVNGQRDLSNNILIDGISVNAGGSANGRISLAPGNDAAVGLAVAAINARQDQISTAVTDKRGRKVLGWIRIGTGIPSHGSCCARYGPTNHEGAALWVARYCAKANRSAVCPPALQVQPPRPQATAVRGAGAQDVLVPSLQRVHLTAGHGDRARQWTYHAHVAGPIHREGGHELIPGPDERRPRLCRLELRLHDHSRDGLLHYTVRQHLVLRRPAGERHLECHRCRLHRPHVDPALDRRRGDLPDRHRERDLRPVLEPELERPERLDDLLSP